MYVYMYYYLWVCMHSYLCITVYDANQWKFTDEYYDSVGQTQHAAVL